MDNISGLNDLIYAGAKLIGDKIGFLPRNPLRKKNPGLEMRLEGQIKKLGDQVKVQR